ncbi:MAG: UvrD-helicase domain-containing protein [Firmicutes bacterium]|nr:UvrD-helicase domain-containing protein [Bacillota bacterium]
MLTEIQKEIVESNLGPALVTAGAGSGKTRVLTHRIQYVIEKLGIPGWKVVALTFTNKAAKEMRERVEKMFQPIPDVFLGTFHSFCVRLLRANIHRLESYTKDFSIYDQSDRMKVLKEVIADGKLNFSDKKDGHKIVDFHMSEIKNDNITLDEYRQKIKNLDDADDIITAIEMYNKKMRANNALDFDDLLLKTLELFNTAPDVLEKLQRRFQYILVDEFQDTNRVQYEILKRLAWLNRNIMVVGDEDQCIYTWRGASIHNIKMFKRDFFPKDFTPIYKLEQNFRSRKCIVEKANKLIAHNIERADKKDVFSVEEGGSVRREEYIDERDEAKNVIHEIIRSREAGGKFGDCAILLRTNAMSRGFEDQLLGYNIPYAIWGGFKFYERAEVKQALSYLKLLVNPNDTIAFRDALSFPKRGIGEVTIAKLGSYADMNREGIGGKAELGLNNFISIMDKLNNLADDLDALAGEFLDITRLHDAYKTGREEDRDRARNLEELVNAIKQFAHDNPDMTLSQYLQSVTINMGDEESAGDRVVISTVHSAKGLEFDRVYVCGVEEGVFPSERSDEEEERRLLYVAITRAKKHLVISNVQSRYRFGSRQFMSPSKFIEELGFTVTREPRFRDDFDPFRYQKKSKPPIASFSAYVPPPTKKVVQMDFAVGDRVTHEKFGYGVVNQIVDSQIISIKFETVGVKMLSVAFANLTKVQD